MLFDLPGLPVPVSERDHAVPFPAVGRRVFSDSVCSQHRSHRSTSCSAAARNIRLAARLAHRSEERIEIQQEDLYEVPIDDPCSDNVAQLGRRENFALGRWLLRRQMLQEQRALL